MTLFLRSSLVDGTRRALHRGHPAMVSPSKVLAMAEQIFRFALKPMVMTKGKQKGQAILPTCPFVVVCSVCLARVHAGHRNQCMTENLSSR
jgi:hypothetical protein